MRSSCLEPRVGVTLIYVQTVRRGQSHVQGEPETRGDDALFTGDASLAFTGRFNWVSSAEDIQT